MSRSHFKGKYIPKNVNKYAGNAKQIIYRSSWERLFMVYCDKKAEIWNWSSEEIKIHICLKVNTEHTILTSG